jgi:hypothetical protein
MGSLALTTFNYSRGKFIKLRKTDSTGFFSPKSRFPE